MKKLNRVIAASFLLALPLSTLAYDPLEVRGVSLLPTEWDSKSSYGSEKSRRTVEDLKVLNVNTIGVRQYVGLPRFNSSEVTEVNSAGLNEKLLRQELRNQINAGLRPFLTIGTMIGHDKEIDTETKKIVESGGECAPGTWFPWHGNIDHGSYQDVDRFFEGYGKVILKYADIAQQEKVPYFSIGNELPSLTKTRPLTELGSIKHWLFKSNEPRERAYAREHVKNLIKFKLSLPGGYNPLDRVRSQKLLKWMIDLESDYKSGRRKPSDLLLDMPSDLQAYYMGLQNIRRAYLEKKWRALIAETRKHYKGTLTYNSNMDDFKEIMFLDQLDVISMNAYFTLTGTDGGYPKASPKDFDELKSSWRHWAKDIGSSMPSFVSRAKGDGGKKIIFSEIGYTSRQFSAAHPWAYRGCVRMRTAKGIVEYVNLSKLASNPQERADAFRALDEVLREGAMPWLSGALIWNAYANGGQDPYSLRVIPNDPTDAAVRSLYEAPADVPHAASVLDYSNSSAARLAD